MIAYSSCNITDQDHSSFSSDQQSVIAEFRDWLARHENPRESGLTYRGRNYGSILTLYRLLDEYEEWGLSVEVHTTDNGKQISGLSRKPVRGVLKKFGETREPTSETGRTSRGALEAAEDLLSSLEDEGVDDLGESKRQQVIASMLRHCVWVEEQYHERARIEFEYDPSESTSQVISKILNEAGSKRGAVAQYLIGAKLSVKYENKNIPNHAASTADDQTGRRGDFDLGDAVIHVTVSPKDSVFKKCKKDVNRGYISYLVVPSNISTGAKEMASQYSNSIEVKSIEGFISQNIDEMGEFEKGSVEHVIDKLLKEYNSRVNKVESDPSMLIEVPDNIK